MLTVILGITTTIFAIGWFVQRVNFYTVLYYITWYKLPAPEKDQWDYCQKQVIRKFLGIKDQTGL